MVRHDHVGITRHQHARNIHALDTEGVEFVQQHRRVNHHTITNHWGDVRIEDSRGNQLEGKGLTLYDDSVAGVVATLVPDYKIHVSSEKVG
jgi:hypothetical protein